MTRAVASSAPKVDWRNIASLTMPDCVKSFLSVLAREVLELDRVPEHLLVIGGGYVGVELSQAMRRFGSKVTVIDRNQRLMAREDEDICEALGNLLADEGVEVVLNARIKRVSGKSGDSVSIVFELGGTRSR